MPLSIRTPQSSDYPEGWNAGDNARRGRQGPGEQGWNAADNHRRAQEAERRQQERARKLAEQAASEKRGR